MSEDRLIRIESRLVQIMFHLGLDPYHKTYETTNKHPTSSILDSCCGEETKGRPA
jgi:hypothetical protein